MRLFIFLVWLLLFWYYWACKKKHCQVEMPKTENVVHINDADAANEANDVKIDLAKTKETEESVSNNLDTPSQIETDTSSTKILSKERSIKIVETADMTTIYFEQNSIKKLDDAEVETYLDQVVKRFENSSEKIKLIGHTSYEGSYAYNLQLGINRATIISDYLIRAGITPNRIIVDSRGEIEPIASNETEEGREKNRRVELIIIE